MTSFIRFGLALAIAALLGSAAPGYAQGRSASKLDAILQQRAAAPRGVSPVIIETVGGVAADAAIKSAGGRPGRRLSAFAGQAAEVPDHLLPVLERHPLVTRVHFDRPTGGVLNRASLIIGSPTAQALGVDGSGVGVAVIDSGITAWHDDLTPSGQGLLPSAQRVAHFVDFVSGLPGPYDDNGHGTHVAGAIAGNGYDSRGARAGIAPGAHLIGLKVLDRNGAGRISNVIAALDYAIRHRQTFNIRVINLSVGAAVISSYWTDPLALAAKSAVDAGIVVVAAAGNLGMNRDGQTQYGAITAPANAPWVLTVGAYSHQGTVNPNDDVVAPYSSRGPSAIDYAAKPDLVAPGTGIVSLSDPTSLFYLTKSEFLLKGSIATPYLPYLSLSGTSMAAPVVAGAVALMVQANPALTPNAVKAILQYTATIYPDYDPLTQGAGFVNARGAVTLARFFRQAQPGDVYPSSSDWSGRIHWGNYRLAGGVIMPFGNAWALSTVWGAIPGAGEDIVWGALCGAGDLRCENIVWGTIAGENIVWGTIRGVENIVWGTTRDGDNIVWGTVLGRDNIVWGTWRDAENIVWGTSRGGENIVWGTVRDAENIVWGTDCGGRNCENIVWGTVREIDNIVWGTAKGIENIVWGTSGKVDNIVWGTSAESDNATWGNNNFDNVVWPEGGL